MYHFAYAEVVEDAGSNSRERERLALDRSIELLKRAERGPAVRKPHRGARTTCAALVDPSSRISRSRRTSCRRSSAPTLISIGIWVMREAERIRDGPVPQLRGLIDVTSIIREA